MHHIRVRRLGAVVAFAAAVAAPAFADEVSDAVAQIAAAVERYKDVDVALAEGYLRDPADHCHTAEMGGMPAELGVMGIHFFRPDLLGVTATDPRVDGNGLHLDWNQPSILIYEPQADGSLELVAVENLVFEAAWTAAGNAEVPKLARPQLGQHGRQPGDTSHQDEAHGFTATPRPARLAPPREPRPAPLEPYNTNATCEHMGHG